MTKNDGIKMETSGDIKNRWRQNLARLEYALQPIVAGDSGTITAFEACLQNHETIGYTSPAELFDAAHRDGLLHQVDLVLRKKAIEKFYKVPFRSRTKLLFRLDGRVLDSAQYQSGKTLALLRRSHTPQEAFFFVIEEGLRHRHAERMLAMAAAYQGQGFSVAIEICSSDAGIIELLRQVRPALIKIHRRIVRESLADEKRLLLMANIVKIAHVLDCPVAADGVDNETLFANCSDAECDLVQGRLVQEPTLDPKRFVDQYAMVKLLAQEQKRGAYNGDAKRVRESLEYIEPVQEDAEIFSVFETFRLKKHHRFFPVVAQDNRPLGIIREESFKDYAYSRFGRDLLQNPAFGKHVKNFLSHFPTADIHQPLDDIMATYAAEEGQEGVFISDNGNYVGYLSAQALLKIVNQKNLAHSRSRKDSAPVWREPAMAASG